jgi:hypothetical protein
MPFLNILFYKVVLCCHIVNYNFYGLCDVKSLVIRGMEKCLLLCKET